MAGAPKTSDELKAAIALRDAGYSIASISEKTGISSATLSRHFAKHKVGKGSLTDEAVTLARSKLLQDGTFIDSLKHEIASTVLDDVAQFRQLRHAMTVTLDDLLNDATLPSHYKMRGLAAYATTLKLSQETIRRALQIDNQEPEPESLPTLTIYELTPEEITQMRQEQTKDAIYDEPDIELIDVIDES
jgi:transposase-like protein